MAARLRHPHVVPLLAADRAANARGTAVLDSMHPWPAGERARSARRSRTRVVAFRWHHYQFLSHPAGTERLMRELLAAVPPETR